MELSHLGGDAAPKVFIEGTHRVCDPVETIQRQINAADVAGITRIADVTGLDTIGIPVVQAVRPLSRSLSVSQGKGATLDAAVASALGESLELWHAEHCTAALRLASWTEMTRSAQVCDVAGLAGTRATRFHTDLRILWIEGHDLVAGGSIWVPYEVVHMDSRPPALPGGGCFYQSSNGLGSGNTVTEAANHALFEVIERDATTLFGLASPSERTARRVDVATVDDDLCRDLINRLRQAGQLIGVWDAMSDVGLPCFSAVIVDAQHDVHRPLGRFGGNGCHADRGVALSRALTEAAQSRLTRIAGSRDDSTFGAYRRSRNPTHSTKQRVELRDGRASRSFTRVPTFANPTVSQDHRDIIGMLGVAGLREVIAVNLTDERLGIPVVRVVVPGLEGPDSTRGYAPGRRARSRLGTGA